MLNHAFKYSLDSSDVLANFICGCSWPTLLGGLVDKQDFLQTVPLVFEGLIVNAPSNYHQALTNWYGDYMQLPPKEKQTTHHFMEAYWAQ